MIPPAPVQAWISHRETLEIEIKETLKRIHNRLKEMRAVIEEVEAITISREVGTVFVVWHSVNTKVMIQGIYDPVATKGTDGMNPRPSFLLRQSSASNAFLKIST